MVLEINLKKVDNLTLIFFNYFHKGVKANLCTNEKRKLHRSRLRQR